MTVFDRQSANFRAPYLLLVFKDPSKSLLRSNHYVQTNVNHLPLKYPQKQLQRTMGGSRADPITFITLVLEIHFKRRI